MKHLFFLLVSALIAPAALATPLKVSRVEPDLGTALGFQIYRFEVKLGDDEVLVIRERTEIAGKVTEVEYAAVGRHVDAKYEIVLVDSSAFNPNLPNTYLLRVAGSTITIEKQRLLQWGHDDNQGKVEMQFCETIGNKPTRKLTWIGSVEKYSDILKRWPNLPKPQVDNSWSGSRRLISKE